MSEDQDWRLTAELDVDGPSWRARSAPRARTRDRTSSEEIETALPHDVVVTHDGKLLFAYAASEEELRRARRVIEEVLRRDGIDARIVISHWDEDRDEWRQVDPPRHG